MSETAFGPGLDQAYALAVSELGMASAAWLFSGEVSAVEGPTGVERLRDALGRRWPVLDAICAARLGGAEGPLVDAPELVGRLEGISRLVVVGFEARWLDALLVALPATVRVGLVKHSELKPDWERVCSNFAGRVELLELDAFQSWAGQRSALLSFVYGDGGAGLFAPSAWVRTSGPDVRAQFRALIGWDVLRVPLSVYPRWLVPVPPSDFTELEAGR